FTDYDEISRIAAEMKQFAKQQPGSSYAVDVRGESDKQVAAERRGTRMPGVLLISADAPLLTFLQRSLREEGYRTLEAPGIPEAHLLLAHEIDLSLIVADARLGDALWELADTLRLEMPATPLLIVSTRPQDEEIGLSHGARAFIQQPFQAQEFL